MTQQRIRGRGLAALVSLLLLAGVSTPPAAQCGSTERHRLAASDGVGDNRFGTYLDLDGDVMVLGAFLDAGGGLERGAAYVYRRSGDDWVEEQKLTAPDGANHDHFGAAVGISGDLVVVGAPGDDTDPSGGWLARDGAAYVFRRQGGTWIFEQKIVPDDHVADDQFGFAVAIDGSAILGSSTWDDDFGYYSGSAYVFRDQGGSWIQEAKLNASDAAEEDMFGYRLDLQGDRAVIGAPKVHSGLMRSGAAYVFEASGSSWMEIRRLEASDFAPLDWFGYDVALDADVVLVGAPSFENRTFAAYFFRDSATGYEFEQKLSNPGWMYSDFGLAVEVDGNRALIGAMGEWRGSVYRAGAAYLYGFDGVSWAHERVFTASDPVRQDQFGVSVAIDGDVAVVGNEPAAFPGRVARGYVFDAHELALYAAPKAVYEGDSLTLTACGGMPNRVVFLAIVSINGAPVFEPLGWGTFGSDETFTISGTVPPNLSGATVECQAAGFSFLGRLVLSNRERIEIL